jgi:hypothetical protein
MATARAGQQDKHSRRRKSSQKHEHEANLGQKEARLEKDKDSELSSLGEMSGAGDASHKSDRHSG